MHCYINLSAGDLAAKERELSTKELKHILEEAASLGCMGVRFSGGEPLLREDFQELYTFTRKLGLLVSLFTNATLITPTLAELFNRIPPLQKIEVTVYGMRKNSYEATTRIPGSYDAAWRGIRLLLKYKIPFVIKGAIFPHNKDEIDEFENWAATTPWADKPPSYSMFFGLRCRRDNVKKNELIKRLRISPEDGIKILTRRQKEYFKGMQEFCPKFATPSGDRLFACGAGVGNGCVDAYGYFQPCMLLKHPDCSYDLKKGTLKDALTNFFPKLRKMKATNPEYLSRCGRCFLKGLCEQCPAKSWAEYGTLDTPVDYLCEVAHAQARYLGLIKEDENAWEAENWREKIENFSEKKPMGVM